MVERGTYNQLADALNRMARKHKKTPFTVIDIVEQLEALENRYGVRSVTTSTSPTVAATADIILSETFL